MSTTKEHPILFSAPMVRAILDGRKTQTRIIAKTRRENSILSGDWHDSYIIHPGNNEWLMRDFQYGKPGDRLWVRETFAIIDDESGFGSGYIEYKATCDNPDKIIWKPSIHMPRWASRILLENSNVRIERLQDISEDDAVAEGIENIGGGASCSPWKNYRIGAKNEMDCHCSSAVRSYKTLWESINGPGSWDLNPLVWVVEFKMLQIK